MAKLSTAAVKSSCVSKVSGTCSIASSTRSNASSTCSTASSLCSTMTMPNEVTSATVQARARAEHNAKVTINTKSHATSQKAHQYVATDSVTSALQGDSSMPKTHLQSQTDCVRAQVPITPSQAHCATASAASSFTSAGTTSKQKGWLSLPIGKLSSGASTQLVSDNHETEPGGLLKFLARYDVDLNCAKEVACQIEVSHDDSNARLPMFTQQIFDDRPHFQIWSQGLSL